MSVLAILIYVLTLAQFTFIISGTVATSEALELQVTKTLTHRFHSLSHKHTSTHSSKLSQVFINIVIIHLNTHTHLHTKRQGEDLPIQKTHNF